MKIHISTRRVFQSICAIVSNLIFSRENDIYIFGGLARPLFSTFIHTLRKESQREKTQRFGGSAARDARLHDVVRTGR